VTDNLSHIRSRALIATLVVGGLLVGPTLLPWLGADAAFASSDGGWEDDEILFKGRRFEDLVVLFELYKLKCNAPGSSLERLTPYPKPWTYQFWFTNPVAKKWRVPFRAGARPSSQSCAENGSTAETFSIAEENARRYIASL